ncbi:dihydrodipicolinate synthase family protein [Amycolatopsis sp. K13G38]|uniref:Dihydrodipicolinate synthase family protein n=1 Tax=Amycolatopsis acididurans TaxID=2724524 RepID=A0ABX1J8T7_9PSEU|nr:dihydrodipicolinate synthase family protein [Amycolatopsis acididurans]NKQ56123.1 dihydrodipicolinate synthase family protein [Amycolatopsis acididurans]
MTAADLFPDEPQIMCMSITPFTPDGNVDENALRAHLRRLIDAHVGVYLASPGSGEGHALTVTETRRVYEIGVEECRGKVPVCANPRESRDVDSMLEIAGIAVAAGVDAVQIYQIDGGHGFTPTTPELYAYFRDVIRETDHPVIIGCNPVAGYLASVDLLERLCREFPRIVAVNVFETPLGYVAECRDRLPDHVRLFCGQTTAVQAWLLGATGMLSAAANVVPHTTAALGRCFAAGDLKAASLAATRLQRFYSAFVHTMAGAAWEKLALKILGLPGGNGVIRRPYLFPDEQAEARMRTQLAELGVPAWETEYAAR